MKVNESEKYFQAKDNDVFPSILREIEKTIPRKAIAAELGMEYKRYCHYVKGDSAYPPDRIRDLFNIARDYRIINVVLPEDMIAVPVVRINPHLKFILKQLQIDTQREANDVLEVVEMAQDPKSPGGKEIARVERPQCNKEIDEAIRQLYQLRMAINGGCR